MSGIAVMLPPTITCQQCGDECPYGPYRHYCQRCRYSRTGKPTKWKFTPAIDARLEAIYKHPDSRSHMTATQYAAQLGWPKHVLIHRAGVLGLSRKRKADYYWTAPEEEILEANAWKSPGRIIAILRARGFFRSRVAIMLKLKRLHIFKRDQTDVYSANGLAKMFGIDSHQVVRWIKCRLLKGSRQGTERNERQGGDMWAIKHADVREFVTKHPLEFDLRKVDPLWFIDLLANIKSLNSYELERSTRKLERAA